MLHSADQAANVLDVGTEPIKYEDNYYHGKVSQDGVFGWMSRYLIFVIFFTRAKFLENNIYTEKRQFFALYL